MGVQVILGVIALFAIGWIYYTVKEKAKRNVFFKEQYEQQKKYTHRDTVITANAPMSLVRESIVKHFPIDGSARAAFVGGNYQLQVDEPGKLVYLRKSAITSINEGDEFTVGIRLAQDDDEQATHVTMSIEQWREHDGVTRRSGIEAMRDFYNGVFQAVRDVDPNATITYSER